MSADEFSRDVMDAFLDEQPSIAKTFSECFESDKMQAACRHWLIGSEYLSQAIPDVFPQTFYFRFVFGIAFLWRIVYAGSRPHGPRLRFFCRFLKRVVEPAPEFGEKFA